eukprot:TRINITY_DN217_c0_g1_i1.p2 TRINITY_DN217_c0_g1~~TRINITY_DN217_c0_g1_i1.p2  ORF type:complete len:248 (-),score=53.46 TRINITY_DN217_c0_g1_i1:154-897(-)
MAYWGQMPGQVSSAGFGQGAYGQSQGQWSSGPGMPSSGGYTGGGFSSNPVPPTFGGAPSPPQPSGGGPGYPTGPSMDPQQQNLLRIFQSVDTDRSNSISALELKMAMERAGYAFSAEACKMMVNMFDADGNGVIDFNEFSRLNDYIEKMRSAFHQVDTDGNGRLDYNEVERALRISEYRLSPQTMTALFQKFDRHRRGTLGLDGYIELCVFIGTARSCFAQYDTQRSGTALFNFDTFVYCANRCNFL